MAAWALSWDHTSSGKCQNTHKEKTHKRSSSVISNLDVLVTKLETEPRFLSAVRIQIPISNTEDRHHSTMTGHVVPGFSWSSQQGRAGRATCSRGSQREHRTVKHTRMQQKQQIHSLTDCYSERSRPQRFGREALLRGSVCVFSRTEQVFHSHQQQQRYNLTSLTERAASFFLASLHGEICTCHWLPDFSGRIAQDKTCAIHAYTFCSHAGDLKLYSTHSFQDKKERLCL